MAYIVDSTWDIMPISYVVNIPQDNCCAMLVIESIGL